ncbi:hypothetical protein [[Mycoplasma] collis]|uniref:hypothetical protein n=1 Tax=[Mycoplasma] collis TaxID=2127 RepID=UPI0012EC2A37|nr:hypothetical protein [[Mycoplasma] collis]
MKNKTYLNIYDYYRSVKKLNSFCNMQKWQVKKILISDILKQNINQVFEYLYEQTNFINFLNDRNIFNVNALWECINQSITPDKKINSQLIPLIMPLINNSYKQQDWIEINNYWNNFKTIKKKKIVRNYLKNLKSNELIKVHLLTNKFKKKQLKKITNNSEIKGKQKWTNYFYMEE